MANFPRSKGAAVSHLRSLKFEILIPPTPNLRSLESEMLWPASGSDLIEIAEEVSRVGPAGAVSDAKEVALG